ncbi:DUF1573 domain-containing protein [Bacteroidia bacterium]|jgi:hypothetical protein|nr:DUF1573 domain-containing protein [Bacteroidia bacterium]
MKKLLLLGSVFALASVASAQAQGDATSTAPAVKKTQPIVPTIEFTELNHDFGNIIEGEVASFQFVFTNKGDDPIKLTNVRASCGCTTPLWTKEEVAPGETGVITAQYNSKGRVGTFHKSITVNSTGGNVSLTIKGVVISEPEKPKSPVIIGG